MVSFEIDCWSSLKNATENILIREPAIKTWSIFGLRSLRVCITGFLLTMFKITRCNHSAPKLCKDFFPPASPRSRTSAAGFYASVGRRGMDLSISQNTKRCINFSCLRGDEPEQSLKNWTDFSGLIREWKGYGWVRSPWVFLVVLLENMRDSTDLLSYEFCPKRQQQQEQQEEE